jgi:hydroxyacylglutathione hydrolase
LLPDDVPLVFVTAPGQDLAELTWQSRKIGYERLAGQLDGGMAAWTADGGQQQTIELVTAERIAGRPVLDVRQRAEHATGHIADAVHIELGDLVARTDEAPDGAVVHCGHGERAMTAASLLQRAGRHTVTRPGRCGPSPTAEERRRRPARQDRHCPVSIDHCRWVVRDLGGCNQW